MEKQDVTCSIVAYKASVAELRKLAEGMLSCHRVKEVVVVDNFGGVDYAELKEIKGVRWLDYVGNLGYGRGHNRAIRSVREESTYHLVVNVDVSFDSDVIARIARYMDANKAVGLVGPRIEDENGRLQHLCKLLPSPLDLFVRRFFRGSRVRDRRTSRLDLSTVMSYSAAAIIPWLSGCFLMFRTSTAFEVGLFDERFFMYMEDLDFSRRMHERAENRYFPEVTVTHTHAAASYANLGMLTHHVRSAVQYFNKWGWWGDRNRNEINRATLCRLGQREGRAVG